jgi:ABC-type glycerol-3-phosphate transport system substrate-binding protein
MKKNVILFIGVINLLVVSCSNNNLNSIDTSLNPIESLLLTPNVNLTNDLSNKYSASNPLSISFSGLSSGAQSYTADFKAIEAFQNLYPYIRIQYQNPQGIALSFQSDSNPNVMIQPYLNDAALALSAKKVYALDSLMDINDPQNIFELIPEKLLASNKLIYEVNQPIYSLPVGYKAGLILKNELFLKYLDLSSEFKQISNFEEQFSLIDQFNASLDNKLSELNKKILFAQIEDGKDPIFFTSESMINPLPQNTFLVVDLRNSSLESKGLMQMRSISFNYLMHLWGIAPLTVSGLNEITPNFLKNNENTLELIDFLKAQHDYSINYFDLSYFDMLENTNPLNYLSSTYLKSYAKLYGLNEKVFDFSAFFSKDGINNYFDYIPYNVYLLKNATQTEDSLHAAWLFTNFLTKEGNVHYATGDFLMPLNKTVIESIEYASYLDDNPLIHEMQDFLDEILFNNNSNFQIPMNSPFSKQRNYDLVSYEFLHHIIFQDKHPDFVATNWTEEEKLNYYFGFLNSH